MEARQLRCGPGEFLRDLDFQIPKQRLTAILGPNGSGKTTLLRTLTGLLPYRGELLLENTPVRSISRAQFALRVAVVASFQPPAFDFSVEDTVALGRFAHRNDPDHSPRRDRDALEAALALTELLPLRKRSITQLSSGEYQRVTLARALAQNTPILLLDEPTAHLDLAHQFRVFEILSKLPRDSGKTVVCVTHDLTLSARFADHLLLLKGGTLAAQGRPQTVLQPPMLRAVFGIDESAYQPSPFPWRPHEPTTPGRSPC
jgi:iron complex transport system ATP-binding protein